MLGPDQCIAIGLTWSDDRIIIIIVVQNLIPIILVDYPIHREEISFHIIHNDCFAFYEIYVY